MTTGYLLIAAVLILGGVLATVGDRLGSKVGKARLSLFKMRPRNTATLVNIVTGSVISAATLIILFAIDRQLWQGITQFEQVQEDLETTLTDLKAAEVEKKRTEQNLQDSRSNLIRIQNQIEAIEADKKRIGQQLRQTQQELEKELAKVATFRTEIANLRTEQQRLVEQRDAVIAQIAQRDQDIRQRDRQIQQRDGAILRQDQEIAQREARAKDLERQLQILEERIRILQQQAEILARNYQELRQGNVVVVRGQVLASAIVRGLAPDQIQPGIDQLLYEANRTATQLALPGTDDSQQQLVLITEAEVEQLIQQLQGGKDYLVRIIAANNVLLGESQVRVFGDVAPNRLVFNAGDLLASATVDLNQPAEVQKIPDRLELLIEAAKFRARRAGFLGESMQIGDGRIETLVRFIEALRQIKAPLEIKVVVTQPTYTAGPFRVDLLAVQGGGVVQSTQ